MSDHGTVRTPDEWERRIAAGSSVEAPNELTAQFQFPTWHEFNRKPLKYTMEMPERAYNIYYFATGPMVITKAYLSTRLCIDQATLFNWLKTQDEFAQAVAAGESLQVTRLASLMCSTKYANGIFGVMKNVHKWSDRTEESHTIIDLREEFKKAAEGAERVQWDKPLQPVEKVNIIDISQSMPQN